LSAARIKNKEPFRPKPFKTLFRVITINLQVLSKANLKKSIRYCGIIRKTKIKLQNGLIFYKIKGRQL